MKKRVLVIGSGDPSKSDQNQSGIYESGMIPYLTAIGLDL